MLSFYQCLNGSLDQKVLLISVSGLDYPPNLGEIFEINGLEYRIINVKHKLSTNTMSQELEFHMIKEDEMEYEFSGGQYGDEFGRE